MGKAYAKLVDYIITHVAASACGKYLATGNGKNLTIFDLQQKIGAQ